MLDLRQVGRKLVVLSLARVDRVDTAQHEARFIELRRRRRPHVSHARKLGRRGGRLRERLLIRHARAGHVLARPRIEHAHVHARTHELLMLMLAAQVDGRRDGARELPHAGHAPVDGHAGPPVGGDPSGDDQFVKEGRAVGFCALGSRAPVRRGNAEEPPGNQQRVLAVAHGLLVGARAHEQLQRREQRRLARARLAREHGQPARRLKRSLADQRKVLNLDLIDHRAPLACRISSVASIPVGLAPSEKPHSLKHDIISNGAPSCPGQHPKGEAHGRANSRHAEPGRTSLDGVSKQLRAVDQSGMPSKNSLTVSP